MKLTLTNSEATGLLSMLQASIDKYNKVIIAMLENRKAMVLLDADVDDEAPEMFPMMYKAIYEAWYRKLAKQMFDKQHQYTMELKPEWACMLHIDYAGICPDTQEGNMVHELCNRIHKEFSEPKYLNHEPTSNTSSH